MGEFNNKTEIIIIGLARITKIYFKEVEKKCSYTMHIDYLTIIVQTTDSTISPVPPPIPLIPLVGTFTKSGRPLYSYTV